VIASKYANNLDVAHARYVQLLKGCLADTMHAVSCGAALQKGGRVEYVALPEGHRHHLEEGRVWPAFGETMIGHARLDNLQHCVEDVLERNIPGDFIEAGVWRGGAAIFVKALLDLHGEDGRSVWLADSFTGPPKPNPVDYPNDPDDLLHTISFLSVSAQEVSANFQRYGLLDERVRLVPGYFKDTLPGLADQTWALIRLDGNLYESTMDGLVHLYPRLAPGGYLIIDDFGCCPSCRQAVEDYRRLHGIDEEIQTIDWTGVFWRKEAHD
jgi:O-methyltransferase